MSLFGKKKEEKNLCHCGGACGAESAKAVAENSLSDASAKILGSGCAKCNQLEANTAEALKQLGLNPAIDHIKDFSAIAAYGVMATPALVYNGKVLSYGKVLKTEEIVALLQKELG